MSKIARIPVSNLPPGVPGLVMWIKRTHPRMFAELSDRMNNYGMGLDAPNPDLAVAAQQPSTAQTILNTVKELVPAALSMYQQNKLFDLQLKRAQSGLAPLDTAAIADSAALRVGVSQDTRNTALIVAGIAGAAILGFAFLRRR